MDIFGTQGRLDHASQLACAGRIDETAACIATASATVNAPAAVVWAIMANLQRWPDVLPGVSRVVLDDPDRPLAAGEGFSWRSGGVGLRSFVQRVALGEELTWTGRALWLVAVHRNTIDQLSDRSCRLASTESMSGPFVSLLMPSVKLQAQLQGFVDAITVAAEHRS